MNKTMKRILGAALALFLGVSIATAILPEKVEAVSHSSHSSGWTSRTSLPTSSGKYYLTSDITLSSTWTAPYGNTTICLNGYDITYTGDSSAILVNNQYSTLTITDCKYSACGFISGGKGTTVTHTDTSPSYTMQHGGVIFVQNGRLDLENGRITGGDANCGGGVCINSGAKFYMTGGYITGNNPTRRGASSSLTGEDTSYGGGLYVDSNATAVIGGGYIGGNKADNGGGIYTASAITLYDTASVSSNTAFSRGGGIYASNNITMKGSARIVNNTANTLQYTPTYVKKAGGGIYFSSGTLNVSGSPVIANNYRYVSNSDTPILNNAYFASSPTGGIVLSDKLEEAADIGVIYETYGKQVTSRWTSKMGNVDYSLYITSDTSTPLLLHNNELWLHTHTWMYEQHATDTDTINIKCLKCALDANAVYGTITINAPDQSHGETEATVDCTLDGITLTEVEYVGTGSTTYAKSTTAPTAPGTYRASITMSTTAGSASAYVDYTIHPTHTHAVCGDSACADHSDITWMPTATLPTEAGNYYLTNDIVLTSTWEIHEDINLCLNGHTVTYALTSQVKSSGIYVSTDSYDKPAIKAAFTNCGSEGGFTVDSTITDPLSSYYINVASEHYVVGYSYYYTRATLDLYNIQITNANAFNPVLGVGVNDGSDNSPINVNMYDSVISGCDGSVIARISTGKTGGLHMYGTSAIRNNTDTGWTVDVDAGQLNMYNSAVIENNEANAKPSYSGSVTGVGGVYVAVQDNDTLYGASMSMHDNSAIRNNVGYRVGGIHAYYSPFFSGDEATAQVVRLYDNASVTGNVGGSSGRIGGGIFLNGDTDYTYTAQMVVGGNVNISGNTLKNGTTNNVYLENEFCAVVPDNSLSTNANIGIGMKTPGVFTQTWESVMGTAAVPTDYFFSDNTNYIVTKIGTELYLTEAPKVAEVTTWPTASDLVYGAKLSASTLTGGEASVEGTFSWSNGNEVPTAGTKEYDVTFAPADSAYAPVTGKVSVTVAKADPIITTAPTVDAALQYGILLDYALLNNGAANVDGVFTWQTPSLRPDAGTQDYTFIFTPDDTDNYNTVTGKVSVTVLPADSLVIKFPTASDLTYGQSLSESTLSGGQGNVGGTFSWTDPTYVPELGTHNVSITFTPSAGNHTVTTWEIPITVKPATPTVTTWPTASGITYGDKLSDSTLSGGEASVAGTFAWTDATIAPNAGTATYSVTFTPDSANYTPVTGQVTVEVAKATPYFTSIFPSSFTKLFASNLTYGQTLGESSITVIFTYKLIPESCTISWDAPDTVPAVGTTFYPVTIYPNNENYTTLSMNLSVTVTQATPVVTTWPTASDIVEGSTVADSVLTGGEASVPGTFSWKNPSDTPALGTNEYEVVFTPDDTTNYEPVVGSVTITVTHDFTEKIVDAAHFVAGSGINCQDAKEYYYDCSKCNTMSTTLTFEEGFGNHVPAETATSNGDGTHSVRCTVDGCNHTISTQDCDGPAATCTTASICDTCGYTIKGSLGHDMNTAWTSQGASGHIRYCARNCGHSETDVHHMPGLWTYVDGTTHTRSCEDNCGYSETANHAGGEASCSSKATCTDCQSQYGNTLPHDWKEDFQYDEEGHWHDCENCNATSTVEPHNPGPEATEDAPQICTTCQRVLVPTLAHVHNNPTYVEEEPATCTKDGKMAHYECRCGLLFMDEACTQQAGDLVIPALQHDMPDTWTMLDESYHTRSCSRNCGHSETAPHAMGDWTYLNEDEHQRSCTEAGCNFTETEDHKGGEANCNDPAECSTCGEHYGEALEHDMPDAWTFLNEEVHQRFCEHGCGHSETDEHHMSAWTYVDENTHQRVCTDETLTREVITACGWVQTAEHSDEDGDGNCDGCAQQMPGTGDGGDGEGGNEGEGGGNTEGDKDDTPNTGDRHMFLLIAAAALFLIGALGAGFKYVYAKRNRFF